LCFCYFAASKSKILETKWGVDVTGSPLKFIKLAYSPAGRANRGRATGRRRKKGAGGGRRQGAG